MKKVIIMMFLISVAPIQLLAHGGGETVTNADQEPMIEMPGSEFDYKEMEELMKKFMTEGALSEGEADKMIAHINELLNKGMMREERGGMMDGDGRGMGFGMMGQGMMGDHDENGMMGDNMMEMMMWLHGLLAVTALVWLVAGILYLIDRDRKIKNT